MISHLRRTLRILAAAGTVAAGVIGIAVAASGSAHADPTVQFVAVGADTTQDVMNQYANDLAGNELGSYDAINPVTAASHETITPVDGAHSVNCSFTRPNGSNEGLAALRKSINQSTTAAQLAAAPQQNCIDINRSSSAPGTNQKADGQLIYIPFALDAVTGATGPASGTNATKITTADDFTITDLTNLYANCQTVTEGGITYNPVTATGTQVQIDLYVPQSGSGTLTFWANKLGFSATSVPACDHQTILAGPDAGAQVEQNDGTAVASDPDGYVPFSIAQWIAQSNGHNDRRHGAVVHDINASVPVTAGGTLNASFPFTREVYNVVQYDQVVNTGDGKFDQALASLLAGANSSLCQDTFTITGYGFALLGTPATTDNCGSTASTLRAFDSTDPV